MTNADTLWWIIFGGFILGMLAFDLLVMHRHAREVSMKEALAGVSLWVILALIFNLGIYLGWFGPFEPAERQKAALEFLTGYVIELSLSVDNVFVFAVIFTYFKVPAEYRHRTLFWGVLGALVMRAVMIFAGIALIEMFHWIIYVFGAFLIYTGIKMFSHDDGGVDMENNRILKFVRRVLPVCENYEKEKFFVRRQGLYATPLFVVLVIIEWTDLIFAVDSIPAILAITQDPFVVYTSNVFAIMGLRSIYFALGGMLGLFRFLHFGLSFVLCFIGVKMVLSWWYKIPTLISLIVVLAILFLSVLFSVLLPKKAGATDVSL